jgi:sugar O-acyltransferase (sialic acid O-acetyltransferase NeuD family)
MRAAPVLVLGAGGFGRELWRYCLDVSGATGGPEPVGFLDDIGAAGTPGPILGTIGDVARFAEDHVFVIGVGDPDARREIATRVTDSGGTLVSVIHPTAYLGNPAVAERGVVICPFSFVGVGATLGDNSVLNIYASVGHDASVGAHSVLSPYSTLNGGAVVGESVLLGTRVTVGPGIRVGDRCRVATGAAVTQDAPTGSLLVGNPARGRVMYPQ